jgi:hypothetical protein
LAGSGIYHGDRNNRLFLPVGTSAPSVVRMNWELLLRDDEEQELEQVKDVMLDKISDIFAAFLQQTQEYLTCHLVPASDRAAALARPLRKAFGKRKRWRLLPFDTVMRTGRQAVSTVERLTKSRRVRGYATIMDMQHGGIERLARDCDGVKTCSLLKRRDLYYLPQEIKSERMNDRHREMLHAQRMDPVQFNIDYAYEHRDDLHAAFVPYRDVPQIVSTYKMLMRLMYENLALNPHLSESAQEFRDRRANNYQKIDFTAKSYLGQDGFWWPGFSRAVLLLDKDVHCQHSRAGWLKRHVMSARSITPVREGVIQGIESYLKPEKTPYRVFEQAG